MTAVIARIGTPVPGKQAEAYAFAVKRAGILKELFGIEQQVYVRFGGPVGQIMGVSQHDSIGQIAELKAKVIRATNEGKVPTAPSGVFAHVEEALYIQP